MRNDIMLLIALAVLLSCCATPKTYSLLTHLQYQSNSLPQSLEDDSIVASFAIKSSKIEITVTNKLDKVIAIKWDEVRLVVINDTINVNYSEGSSNSKEIDISESTVKANSYIQGSIHPILNQELYPTNDKGKRKIRKRIARLNGKPLTILLPYYLSTTRHVKTYKFDIIIMPNK